MTLIKCEECGKEISDKAKFCPHCGKTNKKGNLFLKIIGILFVLCGIAYFMNGNELTSTTSTIQPENIIYQKVSPQDLEKELKMNAARAQQQYSDMYIEFDGKLGTIDAYGEYFAIVEERFSLSKIHCSIKNEQQKQVLISKNKGDTVHVKGKITQIGEIMGYSIDVIELK